MKRILSLVMVLCLLCTVFAGCEGQTAPAPAEAGAPREVLNIGEYDEEWVAADLIQRLFACAAGGQSCSQQSRAGSRCLQEIPSADLPVSAILTKRIHFRALTDVLFSHDLSPPDPLIGYPNYNIL